MTEEDVRLKRSIFDFADEYTNLLLLEKDKEIQSQISDKLFMMQNYNDLGADMQKKINQLQSELSELKSKRKEEIIKAYLEGVNSTGQLGEGMGMIVDINDAEQYYTQTHGQ